MESDLYLGRFYIYTKIQEVIQATTFNPISSVPTHYKHLLSRKEKQNESK
jgi:hypothetical protein